MMADACAPERARPAKNRTNPAVSLFFIVIHCYLRLPIAQSPAKMGLCAKVPLLIHCY
jgi:hypothetical protein